ncbi:MAG: sporulation protein YqfD [Ruminococcus sp.]
MFCWSVDEKEWNVQNKKGAWKHGKSRKIRPRLCVKISVSGEQIERFLNLCRARGLLLENVRLPEEKKLTARISIADFKKLAPIHSKTHVRIHILEKRGLPFFLYRSWRRKCFLTGILLCALLLFWLSGRIWNIHIDGNVKNSTPQLLEFLDQQGVIHGISKKM